MTWSVAPLLDRSVTQAAKFGELTVWDHYSLLLKRGHTGPVICVAASKEVDFIVSGGCDYTVRIWRYDAHSSSYMFHGEVVHPNPAPAPLPVTTGFFNFRRFMTDVRDKGVTAVAVAGSSVATLVEGDEVRLEEDDVFVQAQVQYLNSDFLAWNEHMEHYCGRVATVRETLMQGQVVVVDLGNAVIHWPSSCVERTQKPPMRDGPIISATSEGGLCVLCLWSERGHGRLETRPRLHDKRINSLCVVPFSCTPPTFLLMTASDDGHAALLKLECVEVTPSCPECGGSGCPECHNRPDAIHRKTFLALDSISEVMEAHQPDKPVRMEHRDADGLTPVLDVKSVGELHTMLDRVTFATLTHDCAHLWNSQGTQLMTLVISHKLLRFASDGKVGTDVRTEFEVSEYQFMASANKDIGSLLFVAGEGSVGVWPIVEGIVCPRELAGDGRQEREELWEKTRETWKCRGVCPPPTAGYKQHGTHLDVDQSGVSTAFAVDVRNHGHSIVVWNLHAVAPEFLSLEPRSPSSLLIMSGREKILAILRCNSGARALCVAEDPDSVDGGAGGPALLVGCADGSVLAWDLEGWDKGQVYAEMRSLTQREIYTPLLLLFVTTAQVLSFGFSHPVKWPSVVHAPLIAIGHFVLLDLTAWSFDMSVVYIPELFCNLALVALFNLFVLFDVDGRVNRCIYKARNTDAFKEMRERADKATSPQCHWIHRITDALMDLRVNGSSTWLSSGAFFGLVRVLTLSSYLVSQVKWLCSTMLVVPILRKAVSTFDCQERDGVYYSSYAPKTECFQSDHLILCVGVVLLVPPFLFFVLPYAVVDGDSQFCPRCSTFNWRIWRGDNHWRASAQRKATRVDLGFLRPHPKFAFSSRLVDLVQKVLLPLIFMPLFGRHFGERAQMPFAAVLALWVVYCTIQNPPMLQLKQQRVVLCIKLFILAVMSTGLLTAIVDNETNFISLVLLCCLTSAIFVYMMYGLFTIPLQTRSRRRWEVEEIGEPWPQGVLHPFLVSVG